ncbi:MAG TPA: PfkB family carbohydrate kinase [Lentisphaeria bacterium]|nr:PfkB family carbohydrate kinase [Lentisphaeria bacterium]
MPGGQLSRYVPLFKQARVAVLGDLMLDRYVWGRATRISQEAPVPVVAVQRQSAVPGGAANVARNLRTLGAAVDVFGVIGDDLEGQELLRRLAEAEADISWVEVDSSRPTTVKTRVLAGNQQVVRIDYEQTREVAPELRRRLLNSLEKQLRSGTVQALILEDYAKGLFGRQFMRQAIALAQSYQVMVALDPHPSNNFKANGLCLMTPNRAEAFALAKVPYQSGNDDPRSDRALLRAGQRLRQTWAPEHLLVTLGAGGMALFSGEDSLPVHIPTKAKQVFDVSGAGDTVMATMVLAMLAGASLPEAAEIANHAAGVVVGLVGTAAIDADALIASIDSPT